MPLPVSPEILVVLGTRPEAIKLFPLIQLLQDHPRLRPVVVSTGQHKELVEYVLETAGCEITADLGVGRPGLGLNQLTAAVVSGLDDFVTERYGPPPNHISGRVTRDHYPAGCVVHGDTSSASAAAVAASRSGWKSPGGSTIPSVVRGSRNGRRYRAAKSKTCGRNDRPVSSP